MRVDPWRTNFYGNRGVTAKELEKEGAARATGEGLGAFTCAAQSKQCLIHGASCFREAKGVENAKCAPSALFGN